MLLLASRSRSAGCDRAKETGLALSGSASSVSTNAAPTVGSAFNCTSTWSTLRPTSVYANTRNIDAAKSHLSAVGARWLGSDTNPTNGATMAGLTASQGQIVMMDGGAMQSMDVDLTATGTFNKEALKATGGVATGFTSLRRIK